MKDINSLNSADFVESVERLARKYWTHRENILLSNHVLDSSNLQEERTFWFSGRKLKNLIQLGILVWYAPEEIKYMLLLDLEAEKESLCLEDQFLLSQFLNSKEEMLLFLLETQMWHTRDFFGNILHKDLLSEIRISVRRPRTKVSRSQRKRGYQDHGYRKDDSRWVPTSDWSLTEKQNQWEERKISLQDTLSLSIGFIT